MFGLIWCPGYSRLDLMWPVVGVERLSSWMIQFLNPGPGFGNFLGNGRCQRLVAGQSLYDGLDCLWAQKQLLTLFHPKQC